MVFRKNTSFSLHFVFENSRVIVLKQETRKIKELPIDLF
jgi:hypothetical protein